MSIKDWLENDKSYDSEAATAISAISATASDSRTQIPQETDREDPAVLADPPGELFDLPTWCRPDCENLRHHHLSGREPLTGCEIVITPDHWDFYRIDSLTGCPKKMDNSIVNDPTVPLVCRGCKRLESLSISGKNAHGCLYQALGEYSDGWRRLPANLERCLTLRPPIRGTSKLLNLSPPTGNLRAWLD